MNESILVNVRQRYERIRPYLRLRTTSPDSDNSQVPDLEAQVDNDTRAPSQASEAQVDNDTRAPSQASEAQVDNDTRAPSQASEASPLALNTSVTSLKELESEMDMVDSRMTDLEQKANGVITSLANQIGFIISYSGAWIFYQHLQLSCTVAGWITVVSVLLLIGGLGIAIWAAMMELRRMIPSVKDLDPRRESLAEEAKVIYDLESKRTENENEKVDDSLLHPTVKCSSVIKRSQVIANSDGYLIRFERYNWLFIWAAIICVVVNVAGICCIVYFTYCRIDVLGCTNPMMLPQPGKSTYMFKYDATQKVPATVGGASELSSQTDAILGDKVPKFCPASITSSELASHLVSRDGKSYSTNHAYTPSEFLHTGSRRKCDVQPWDCYAGPVEWKAHPTKPCNVL